MTSPRTAKRVGGLEALRNDRATIPLPLQSYLEMAQIRSAFQAGSHRPARLEVGIMPSEEPLPIPVATGPLEMGRAATDRCMEAEAVKFRVEAQTAGMPLLAVQEGVKHQAVAPRSARFTEETHLAKVRQDEMEQEEARQAERHCRAARGTETHHRVALAVGIWSEEIVPGKMAVVVTEILEKILVEAADEENLRDNLCSENHRGGTCIVANRMVYLEEIMLAEGEALKARGVCNLVPQVESPEYQGANLKTLMMSPLEMATA